MPDYKSNTNFCTAPPPGPATSPYLGADIGSVSMAWGGGPMLNIQPTCPPCRQPGCCGSGGGGPGPAGGGGGPPPFGHRR